MDAVDETLEERGEVYGDYRGGSELRAGIMGAIDIRHRDVRARQIDPVLRVYIFDIVNKLARLATSPEHLDTWLDIAGYATLAKDALQEEQNAKTDTMG